MFSNNRILTLLAVFLILVYILGCSGGRDLGVETPVPDGTIVLVKKGDALGAFVLKNQVLDSNEAAEYTWYYRTDGQATFLSDEAHLFQQGEGKTSEVRRSDRPFTHIEFGPFRIGWSAKAKGKDGYTTNVSPERLWRLAIFSYA